MPCFVITPRSIDAYESGDGLPMKMAQIRNGSIGVFCAIITRTEAAELGRQLIHASEHGEFDIPKPKTE